MATHTGRKVSTPIKSGKLRTINFSGTVKLDGSGVVRTIIGYKNIKPEILFTTESDSSGDWVLPMLGGPNEKFRIIAVGIDGENSEIFDGLTG